MGQPNSEMTSWSTGAAPGRTGLVVTRLPRQDAGVERELRVAPHAERVSRAPAAQLAAGLARLQLEEL